MRELLQRREREGLVNGRTVKGGDQGMGKWRIRREGKRVYRDVKKKRLMDLMEEIC